MTVAQQDLTTLVDACLSDSWRSAFAATPRELFIPGRALRVHDDDATTPIDRDTDPASWMRAVYSNDAIVTQFDDGTPGGDGDATSSSSMLSIMLTMLNHLDVRDGHRVLEIGAGTGYNAALLAHRLGAENVVSIEIDPEIVQQARNNLARAGRKVPVITGDGAAGHPPSAPYDRIIATCSVATVPWSWVEQTRPGGVIVTPWGPPMANDHLLRIDVDERGGVGTIVDSVEFMRLRSQRWQITDEPDDFADIAVRSRTDLDPHEVLGNHSTLAPALRMGNAARSSKPTRPPGRKSCGCWPLTPGPPSPMDRYAKPAFATYGTKQSPRTSGGPTTTARTASSSTSRSPLSGNGSGSTTPPTPSPPCLMRPADVTTTQTIRPAAAMLAAGADVLAVLAFAAVGRSSHAEVADAWGVLSTAAPFLLGLLAGWLVARAWRAPVRLPVGLAVWAGTVIVGLGVRAAFTHRLPLTFVLIVTASLALLLLGWRALARLSARLRRSEEG